MARTLMFQSASASSGKGVLTLSLCRILRDMNCKVAPFKAVGLTDDCYQIENGFEIGWYAAAQALAAGITPTVEMNPIILKPITPVRYPDNISCSYEAELFVLGDPYGIIDISRLYLMKDVIISTVQKTLKSLMQTYDILLIEGAGGPVELNAVKNDFMNMKIARLANTPVILLGDASRGGVFASLIGTFKLLEKADQDLIQGFIINKFHGDLSFLSSGVPQLELLIGKPSLGIIPENPKLNLAECDLTDSTNAEAAFDKCASFFRNRIDLEKILRIVLE